ncbi:hypothetical protein N7504_007152 [Penicillium tannophilum]|nr:hypothetical protein N7504_007152 [Penicillium tannophilum]
MTVGYDWYTGPVLQFYNLQVWFNHNYVWRCSPSMLQSFFAANAGPRHMDVGPGTGVILVEHREAMAQKGVDWPQEIALVDMNPNCLEMAKNRLGTPERTTCVNANVFEPFVIPASGADDNTPRKFDSIALMNVLHTLPPPSQRKATVFKSLKKHLSPNGTLCGSTVLGRGVQHNLIGRLTMWIYNRNKIFENQNDSPEIFTQALKEEFEEVETTVMGAVLLFRARKPKLA